MTFLGDILSDVIEWMITKLIGLGIVEIESIQSKLKIASMAKTDAQALISAKTEDEQKEASINIDSDTFGK
jgi:hypothetical protein